MSEVPPTVDPREMFEHLPFPFEDGKFPAQLGVVVQRTVVDGREPAREVVHTDGNSWLIGDGVNDPNLSGAATVLHIRHLLQADPTLEAMATLPLGHVATRQGPGSPWVIVQHVWPEEP